MARPVLAPAQAAPETAVDQAPPGWTRWVWARHWEFWLALAIGIFLRFWHLDLTTFLVDQNISMRLARTAIVGHLVPVTSVEYSVGGYAPPFGLYLVMPFAFFTHDPWPTVLSIALWNVLGIALCYVFALKYFGRLVAGVGTLIFATCGVAVNYSRFIWQPNYETTFLILWALALFAWCLNGKRRYFAVSVVLLLLLLEISPVAVLLVVVTAVAWLLTARRPRWRDYAVTAIVVLVLLAPTLLWEAITGGLDVRLLSHAGGQPATISLTVLKVLMQTIGAPSPSDLGPASLYARFGAWYPLINLLAVLFFAAGWLILSGRLLAPVLRAWRAAWRAAGAETGAGAARITERIAAVWRERRTDRRWSAELLLWLWVTLPPLSMVRHSSLPTVHYLILMFPAVFLVAAYPVLFLREFDLLGWIAGKPLRGPLGKRAVARAGLALVALLIAAQTVQSALYPASLVAPGFDALNFYGFPLAEMQAAEQRITALQRQQGAAAVYISLPAAERYEQGMDYLLVGEHADRIGFADNCLVLPPPGAPPTLIVSTEPNTPSAAYLAAYFGSERVAQIPMVGGAPFQVYRISGQMPSDIGESEVEPVIYQATPHDALRLDATVQAAPGMLGLRWTVLAAGDASAAPEVYHIQAAASDGGGASATLLGAVDCQPTHWQTGQTVLTWLSLAPATASGGAATATATPPGTVALTVSASAPQLYEPSVGPLHLMSGRYINDTPTLVRPVPAPGGQLGIGNIASDGSFVLPVPPAGS